MSRPAPGATVRVHYTGTLPDGTQFDSSRGGEPLEFTLGEGRLINGFEQAVEQMALGEQRTVNITAQDAYGPRYDELLQSVPRSAIPEEIELHEGLALQGSAPDGHAMRFTVIEFDAEQVTLDGNHPLAGEDLVFEIELLEIV